MPRQLALTQPTFPGMNDIEASIGELAEAGIEERGAIFTKPAVVDLILDLVGYSSDRRLFDKRLLEPSFGHGSFLLPAIDRLLASWQRLGSGKCDELLNAITAVELHRGSFNNTRTAVLQKLADAGIGNENAQSIADQWMVHSDFLLERITPGFDFVAGNPPYVRIERVPPLLMQEYRKRFATMFDRADIYVAFWERSLDLLAEQGKLGFICADRWTKNRYGGPLREKIATGFHLESYIDMNGVDAFESDVIAYPAIAIIGRTTPGSTKVVCDPSIASLESLSKQLSGDAPDSTSVTTVQDLASGSAPWMISQSPASELLKQLEASFPTIEEAGCRVGIGVATGADKVFIGPYETLDVEDERKLPLATTKDITSGRVKWKGQGIVNPFTETGHLAPLESYPRFRRYMESHQEKLRSRHVAKRAPKNWYRTIDRIHTDLTQEPKLLIPDIKGVANIVVEEGRLYPHHNLYYITSSNWDIEALKVVLLTGIAHLFVSSYSTKMRGGFLRFQAQHLRRVRLPLWQSLGTDMQQELKQLAKGATGSDPVELVAAIYGMNAKQRAALAEHAKEAVT